MVFFPAGIYLLKVNKRNSRARCEIYSKLTIKIPERRQWRRFGIFIVNLEHISHLVLVFLLLTLKGCEWADFYCIYLFLHGLYFTLTWNHIKWDILLKPMTKVNLTKLYANLILLKSKQKHSPFALPACP